MNKEPKYIFDCKQFHSTRKNYLEEKECTHVIKSDDLVSFKAEVLVHLMQNKPKEIAEHHYQDYPNLNVEADVDIYLGNPNSGTPST